ncbi:MAG: exostosin family protein, partial [Kangiellaceae bacterium]|nr:exostosin family protein [Kangiellaceae bacterium]
KYRAGIKTNKDGHPTSLEFYENIKNSDYVVCMRGAGNFSNRFYETLAMGRIPVFINTDCLLPLEEVIQWKNHVVWVEYNEREKITEKILEFHSILNEESMNALFDANRRLWRDHLQRSSYFKTLLNEA